MITLQNLSGAPVEAEWKEPRGILSQVYNEPKPGVIRKVSLGEGGLLFQRGNLRLGIPLAELLALAEKHLPGFAIKETHVDTDVDRA